MRLLEKFSGEVKKFSRDNWWVFIIYAVLMMLIVFLEEERSLGVFVITSIHFIADIFIMMMISAYSEKRFREGTYFQIISLVLFMSLKIYTGLNSGGWHYLAADPIYILAAIKNYSKDVYGYNIRAINYKSMTVLSLLTIGFVFFFVRYGLNIQIWSSVAQAIQTAGIFLFAIALSITGQERLRYKVSVVALFAMVVGSAWETYNTMMQHAVVGLALSYTLLPLTVFAFYIRDARHFLGDKNRVGQSVLQVVH
jgi:hypothetical protein